MLSSYIWNVLCALIVTTLSGLTLSILLMKTPGPKAVSDHCPEWRSQETSVLEFSPKFPNSKHASLFHHLLCFEERLVKKARQRACEYILRMTRALHMNKNLSRKIDSRTHSICQSDYAVVIIRGGVKKKFSSLLSTITLGPDCKSN